MAEFLLTTIKTRRQQCNTFIVMEEEKKNQSRILNPEQESFKNEEEMTFSKIH